ncbi:polysaccharide biosynthesis protein [Corynebacterium sp. YIM 101645]|uniref:Polysaccharide biosynthesis protein n=1 Tax=Corynebacterium lemuris TaxID=1859292 RepID=A0ABT2FZY0_9CORY|nr:nucleoside-diphosphate sugar epimerase/dehydratase [Corynebacterium lemuris]MCS5480808.1 polysaccharide biosynthesis protein [Corynebacterium lemuris]
MKLPVGRILYLVDVLVWILAILVAALLRYEFAFAEINWFAYAGFVLGAAALQLVFGLIFHLYRKGMRFRAGGFEDTLSVSLAAGAVGSVLWIISLVVGGALEISRGVMLIAIPGALILMLAVRFIARVIVRRSRKPGPDSAPALILGGGYVGTNLIQWMMADPSSPYRPVGVIDDDPNLVKRKIRDVPVVGKFSDIEPAAERTGAEVLIVAISTADAALLRRVQDVADRSGLSVKVMPPIGHVVANGIHGGDLRDLSIEDLLGRQPVETNVSEIAQYLTHKRVLVTGAGGSIGAQLCTEIAKYGPAELIMLDRDETGLQQALINVHGNGLLDTDAVVLADIREPETLKQIFQTRRPEVVFHAAALKHLPMLEQYPDEAWKTNVLGTLNVLNAAQAVDVETFVNISTDKAANPTSVLGHSKRVAEKLTGWFGQETDKNYLSVRFGNVIGSRGSMLPTFIRLIDEDKPLTVTHPDVTRYFMTIPEACQLVLQAGGIGRAGEVLILDMGEPVSILEIAKRMIAMSGKNSEVVFTGLREGEKLHEELVGAGEREDRPFHPKISHADVNILAPTNLDKDGFMGRIGKLEYAEKEATR